MRNIIDKRQDHIALTALIGMGRGRMTDPTHPMRVHLRRYANYVHIQCAR